jgi:hypothetical protein
MCVYPPDFVIIMRSPSDAISSLTGLLSFMLSDEMTTGSVTSSDAHKRQLAARSHAWNLEQPRFKDIFPEVSWPCCKWLVSCAPGAVTLNENHVRRTHHGAPVDQELLAKGFHEILTPAF